MLAPVLDETGRRLLADERRLLGELREWLSRLDADESHRLALAASLDQLDEPVRYDLAEVLGSSA